jgi:hypothetical protein
MRSFVFCFSSLAERWFAAARSGQGRAVLGAAERDPLPRGPLRQNRGGRKRPGLITIMEDSRDHDQ